LNPWGSQKSVVFSIKLQITIVNQGWTYQEKVDRTAVGKTVLNYYTQKYHHSSESEWRSRIDLGQVLLDEKRITPETVLRSGQILTYHRPPWQEPEVPLFFEVLYEDADLLVIAKPPGLPVMPGGGFLEHTLLWQLKKDYPQKTPVPIHRLGRGTSGLLLLARSPQAKSNLTQQMRDRQIRKVYLALASGIVKGDRLTIDRAIGKIPHPILGYIYAVTPNGLFAYSECQVLKRYENSTLLEVTILTGRPHQIRIHLAAAGFPLVGDPLYDVGGIPKIGKKSDKLPVPGDCGYHLHAYHFAFHHPRTGEYISIFCPPFNTLHPLLHL
jgi:23S rRNA pseudouridine1911/1915/1917 synthase